MWSIQAVKTSYRTTSVASCAGLALLLGSGCGDVQETSNDAGTIETPIQLPEAPVDAFGEPLCVTERCGQAGMPTEDEFEALAQEFYDICLSRAAVECELPCDSPELNTLCQDPEVGCKDKVQLARCTRRTVRHTKAMQEMWNCERETAHCLPAGYVGYDYSLCDFEDELAVEEVTPYRFPDPYDALARPLCD